VIACVRLAEVVNQYMAKGKRVRVIGRQEYQSWADVELPEQLRFTAHPLWQHS
jgi:single-stranded DNA-binding protein